MVAKFAIYTHFNRCRTYAVCIDNSHHYCSAVVSEYRIVIERPSLFFFSSLPCPHQVGEPYE